nr:MAG TPA: hypothetical protein [Caudoviricetes sp.]
MSWTSGSGLCAQRYSSARVCKSRSDVLPKDFDRGINILSEM